MGKVPALHLRLAPSGCGDLSPCLDVVLDHQVATATDESVPCYQAGRSPAQQAAADKPVLRPVGHTPDALCWGDPLPQQAGCDQAMPSPRLAIESRCLDASDFARE